MANAAPIAIGTVAELNGSAQAENPITGEVRDLQVGDMVYAHEVIITADGSNIVLAMGDGNKLAIGESSELGLNADGIGATRFASLTEDTTESAADNALPDTDSIGTVVALSGNAEARNPITGETRDLQIGDLVYADEIIVTADGSAIAIEFADGSRLDLGRNSEMALNSDVFDMAILATLDLPGTTAQSAQEDMFNALVNESSAELDAIQQALLAGEDPSLLEATAAGPGTGGGGEGEGSSFVILERSGQQTTPDSGFNTDPTSPQFTPTSPEDLPVEEEEAGPIPVTGAGVSFLMNGVEVSESNLLTGSNPNDSLLTMPGSFFIVAPDGVATAFTNPTFIINNAFNFGALDGNVADTTAGMLKFIGYNPTTGEVTYEYTLEQAVDHRSQSSDVFTITVTDEDGDIGVANLVVNIVDDQPVAGNDVITLTGTDESGTVSNADDTFADQPGSISLSPVQPGDGYALVTTDDGTVAVGQFGTLSYDASASDGDGAWTYTLNNAGKAEIKALDEGETIEGFDANFKYLLTDYDETNPAPAFVSINVSGINDAPTIDVVPSVSMVSEEGLSGGLPDSLGSPDDTNLATFTGQVLASDPDTLDADNLVFSLHEPTTGVGSTFFTWSGDGTDTLIGSVGDEEKIKIELTDDQGNYLVTLLGPIDHENTQIEDALEFAVGVSVSDGDLSSATSDLNIRIEDDSPVAFTTDTARISDQVADERSVTADLHFKTGADGLGNVVFNLGGVADGTVAATDASGAPLLLNGEPLYIHGDGTGTLQLKTEPVANLKLKKVSDDDPDPTLGMEITLNPADGTYTLTTFGIVTINDGTHVTDLKGIGGGNVSFKGLMNIDGGTEDVLMSSASGETINTNFSEIGISTGNSFEDGEYIRFDFVNGLAEVPVATHASGFTYADHSSTHTFRQTVSKVNGGSVSLKVTAIYDNDSDRDYSNDTMRTLNTADFRVISDSGVDKTGVVTLTQSAGSVIISGLEQDWTFEFSSESEFNAVRIDALDNDKSTFKLGYFGYSFTPSGEPIDLDYALLGTDADDDSAEGSLSATLYPEGISILGDTGNDVDDILTGTDGADFIFAYAGDDEIDGGAGADHIMAGKDNDTIVYDAVDVVIDGGEGFDTLLVDGALTGAGVIEHIEKLDMSDSDDNDSITLTADDVLDLSETGTLFIDGDTDDSVTLTSFVESAATNQNEANYTLYEGTTSAGNAVKVYVDDDITPGLV